MLRAIARYIGFIITKSRIRRSVGSRRFNLQHEENGEQIIKSASSFRGANHMKAGTVIGKEHIRRIRPGFGLAPKYYDELIGRTVKKDIERGTATSWALLNK